jgi:hypothetical protein
MFSNLKILSLLLAVSASLTIAPVDAQQRSENPFEGERVRITAPNFFDGRVTGTVVRYDHNGIAVQHEATGEIHAVPYAGVQQLDRFLGGSPASTAWYRGRLFGFLGMGLGTITGALIGDASGLGFVPTLSVGAAIGAITGGAAGAVYGANNPVERWGWVPNPWGYDPNVRPISEAVGE